MPEPRRVLSLGEAKWAEIVDVRHPGPAPPRPRLAIRQRDTTKQPSSQPTTAAPASATASRRWQSPTRASCSSAWTAYTKAEWACGTHHCRAGDEANESGSRVAKRREKLLRRPRLIHRSQFERYLSRTHLCVSPAPFLRTWGRHAHLRALSAHVTSSPRGPSIAVG